MNIDSIIFTAIGGFACGCIGYVIGLMVGYRLWG